MLQLRNVGLVLNGKQILHDLNLETRHGESGGIEVLPVVKVVVDEGGTLKNEFKLIKGAVGLLRIDYEGDLKKDAVCELRIEKHLFQSTVRNSNDSFHGGRRGPPGHKPTNGYDPPARAWSSGRAVKRHSSSTLVPI